ncbi:MFS transporter [Amycolatopsis sp.]|uniref:MFS transporter n=1 Tax=Amycolatopsis sp. TaxID=37632 RepID=UPI002C43B39D|nr:MFS transporter [Amycolatopsis sp.]HVV12644.1 MFS transporter [Amycolatopsis sp.]
MSEAPATPLPTEDPGAPAIGGPRRSTGYYVLLIVVVLLMAETTVHGAILLYSALPYMYPAFTSAQLPWIITVTLLVAGAMQPLIGKLADVFGRKRLLLTVAVLYIAGSVLGAVAGNFQLMLVARILQAAAVALPGVIYSFFRDYLPRRMVPISVGLVSTNIGVSAIVAPFIAGGLLSGFGTYRAIFWFCAIYMAVVAPIVYFVIPEIRQARKSGPRQRVDFLGSAMFTVGAGLILFGISDASTAGWTSTTVLLSLVLGVALLVAFGFAEYRIKQPMIDMRLLGGHALRTTLLVSLFAGVMSTAWGYVVPQLLETHAHPGIDYGFGLSATEVGVVTLANGILSMACGPLGGYLTKRTSPRFVMLLCCLSGIVAAVLTALWHSELWHFVVFGLIMGISSGFYYASGPNLVIEAVPSRVTGVSTGMQAFTSAFGGSAMPVVIAAVLAANVLEGGKEPVYASHGYTAVFLILAAAGVVALVMTSFMRHGRQPATGGAVSAHH